MKSPTTEAGPTPTVSLCVFEGQVYRSDHKLAPFTAPDGTHHADFHDGLAALVYPSSGWTAEDVVKALNSHTRLESEVEALREGLQDLDAAFVLFLHERNLTVRADETIVRDAIKRACDLLARSTPKPAQGTEGRG